MVHQDVCGAFGFGRGNGKHIRATAKAVREKEDVGISSSRSRQGPKTVNTDGNARAVGQGDGEDGPANCLAGGLTCGSGAPTISRRLPCRPTSKNVEEF